MVMRRLTQKLSTLSCPLQLTLKNLNGILNL